MKITGELLKSERIKLKITQQDVGFSLKLSARTINAIEEGDLSALPAKTFVRGFVKSYAELLKLDSTLVLNQYQEEMGTTRLISTPSENAKVKKSKDALTEKENVSTVTPNLKTSLNKNTFKIAALIAIAVICTGGINQILNKYQHEGTAPISEKLSVENINQEENSKKEINPTENITTTAETTIPQKANEEPTKAETTDISKVTPEEVSNESVITNGKSIELVIEATKDTKISYAVGNDTTFKNIDLTKNTFQIIKSKNGLRLKAEDGSSISITVNGINKGLASSDAKPIQISY